jgi:hypothetical protein
MKAVLTSGIILSAIALAAFQISSAQTPAHAPDGGSFERIQSVSIPPKTSAPFTATVVTEWTRLLEDGTTTTIKNHRTVARDSVGRVFQERRNFTPNGDKETTTLSELDYSDPIRHELYVCSPRTHTCNVHPYDQAAATPVSSPASVTLPKGAGSITLESLGQSTIGNLEVLGSREITTINPGANGYQHPEPTIKEFWYSPQLEVNLITKRFEPRGGAQNFSLENINLNEPNPDLFVLPANYKLIRNFE